jgi:hypothetical protein
MYLVSCCSHVRGVGWCVGEWLLIVRGAAQVRDATLDDYEKVIMPDSEVGREYMIEQHEVTLRTGRFSALQSSLFCISPCPRAFCLSSRPSPLASLLASLLP